MTAHRDHDHMKAQANASTSATTQTAMMMASHSHIDATPADAYVGGWPSQELEGRAEPVI